MDEAKRRILQDTATQGIEALESGDGEAAYEALKSLHSFFEGEGIRAERKFTIAVESAKEADIVADAIMYESDEAIDTGHETSGRLLEKVANDLYRQVRENRQEKGARRINPLGEGVACAWCEGVNPECPRCKGTGEEPDDFDREAWQPDAHLEAQFEDNISGGYEVE